MSTETEFISEKVRLLSKFVKPYLTEKRYRHTISVANEVRSLGGIYLPDRLEDLQISALLHDITKKDDIAKQLQYCQNFDIITENDDLLSKDTLHALTAAALAERKFADYVNGDVLSGIRWHTTGHDGMSIFESLVYLADYIEETRVFEGSVRLRRYLYDRISSGCDKYAVLYDSMIYSFNMTIEYLIKKDSSIDGNTVSARNYFISQKNSLTDNRSLCNEKE